MWVVVSPRNRHYVKSTALLSQAPVSDEEITGGDSQSPLFCFRYRIESCTELIARSVTYLDEYDDAAVEHDEIDLPEFTTKIPLHKFEAMRFEITLSLGFGPVANLSTTRIW